MTSGFRTRKQVMTPRFRMLAAISRAYTSSVFVFGLPLNLFGGVLGTRLDGGSSCGRCSSRPIVVCEDAVFASRAVPLFVKGAWTIMMEFARFAFVAFAFQVVVA